MLAIELLGDGLIEIELLILSKFDMKKKMNLKELTGSLGDFLKREFDWILWIIAIVVIVARMALGFARNSVELVIIVAEVVGVILMFIPAALGERFKGKNLYLECEFRSRDGEIFTAISRR